MALIKLCDADFIKAAYCCLINAMSFLPASPLATGQDEAWRYRISKLSLSFMAHREGRLIIFIPSSDNLFSN